MNMAKMKENGEALDKAGGSNEHEFDKEQIVASARYSGKRDMLDALLEKGKKYTIAEVDRLADRFMKGAVK